VLAAPPVLAADEQGASGKVIRVPREAFAPSAGLISFSEMPMDTPNPVYRPADYGGPADGAVVSFGGYFAGQMIGAPGDCGEGAAETGCVVGTPTSPLKLSQSAPDVTIGEDGAQPATPVLTGTPRHNGPISMVFDRDLAGVGLNGGHFNALRSVAIQAYDRYGRVIGSVVNINEGIEYLALVTEDGSESIAGLQFHLVGPEPAGFSIDELSFARRSQLQDSVAVPGGDPAAAAPVRSIGDLIKERAGAPPKAPPVAPAKPPGKTIKELMEGR
jgi:hypothetical protein